MRKLLCSLMGLSLILQMGCSGSSTDSSQSGTIPSAESQADQSSSSNSPSGYKFPATVGKYVVLDILTDNKDNNLAKSNAEGALTRYPDIGCMVGLWAYNPPMILSALKAAGKEGTVKVVGFDEQEETLQAISEGRVVGTIVQDPYGFGYRSVELLSAMARGQQVEVPDSGMIFVPHKVIRADNVQEFAASVAKIKAGEGPELEPYRNDYDTSKPVKVAYITNSVDPFWTLAQFGCEKAAKVFSSQVAVQMPSIGTVEEQKRYIEANITEGIDGMAISPIDPVNQAPLINQACEKMIVICQDSDAPNSNRRFYLGTSNYLAGRAAGKLVKEALPDGGKVMIFVGKMEVLNAQERSRGVIDELADKPIPAILLSGEEENQ